jgi:undecaprenyl-diphosphatase
MTRPSEKPAPEAPPREQRTVSGTATRGVLRPAWNLIFRVVRWLARHGGTVYQSFGIVLLGGATAAILLTIVFAELAGHVNAGRTQAFDDAVMQFVARHQQPLLRNMMVEITALGTGIVVTMIVVVSSAVLWLNHHRHSAVLLLVVTVGGIVLNNLLKSGFGRPRPQIFEWGTHALSSSFPSGHAMSSAVVYGTVAYLVARLQRERLPRVLTIIVAGILIVLISASRLYLGVHYPSDVLAGVVIGLAWTGFCMAVLEAAQMYARRNAPEMLESDSGRL